MYMRVLYEAPVSRPFLLYHEYLMGANEVLTVQFDVFHCSISIILLFLFEKPRRLLFKGVANCAEMCSNGRD